MKTGAEIDEMESIEWCTESKKQKKSGSLGSWRTSHHNNHKEEKTQMNRSRDKEEMATDSLASVNPMDISGHCARLLPFALGVYPRPESLHHVGTLCPAFRSRWMALQGADLLYIPVSGALGTPSATWMLGTALGSSVKAACALLTTTVSLSPSHLFCVFSFSFI